MSPIDSGGFDGDGPGDFFSEDELVSIVEAYSMGHPEMDGGVVPEEIMETVYKWFTRAEIHWTMAEAVLAGGAYFRVENGDLKVFPREGMSGAVAKRMRERGHEMIEFADTLEQSGLHNTDDDE